MEAKSASDLTTPDLDMAALHRTKQANMIWLLSAGALTKKDVLMFGYRLYKLMTFLIQLYYITKRYLYSLYIIKYSLYCSILKYTDIFKTSMWPLKYV